ncbi:hypothetical protein H0266_17495 [Halobacillus locisalis]|uniref:Uncharacterized protein n=1 Tax=Halobacillus locisalis TaxID=220753 RepID=A0A838CYY7_9BACI|nr:hypothetical protein [Halobacillus locisalis]MBA2176686.1 hypothetical protein [Halobacillus locisalis]
MAYFMLGLIVIVIIVQMFKYFGKTSHSGSEDRAYTPHDDLYSGKSRDYDARPIPQSTKKADVEQGSTRHVSRDEFDHAIDFYIADEDKEKDENKA